MQLSNGETRVLHPAGTIAITDLDADELPHFFKKKSSLRQGRGEMRPWQNADSSPHQFQNGP
jgi:hypothetical protein